MYTYRFYVIDGEGPGHEPLPVVCTPGRVVFPHAFVHETDLKSAELIHYRDGEPRTFNVRLDASTRLIAKGPYASRVRSLASVCLINERPLSGTVSGKVGAEVFTWRLPRPARNVVEVVSHPATEAEIVTSEEEPGSWTNETTAS